MSKTKAWIFLLTLMGWLWAGGVGAAEDMVEVARSKYFTVLASPGADLQVLIGRLDINASPGLDDLYASPPSDVRHILAGQVDTIYDEASDALGITLPRFESTIKIYDTHEAMSQAFFRMYGVSLKEDGYYDFEHNVIYVSADTMDTFIMGHEIAHAIVCRYFVVPPPPKIQEVLCGYVEYKFRKKTGSTSQR